MKKVMVFVIALALAAAGAAGAQPRLALRDGGPGGEPAVSMLDLGSGPVAAVFVARRAVIEPALAPSIIPLAGRFRVIAFLVDGVDLAAIGGAAGLASGISAALDREGLESACVVSCEDCLPAAIALAEARAEIDSLVVLGPAPEMIAFKKSLFVASNAGAELESAISAALAPKRVPVPARGGFKPL
jgi:hypothetical protein